MIGTQKYPFKERLFDVKGPNNGRVAAVQSRFFLCVYHEVMHTTLLSFPGWGLIVAFYFSKNSHFKRLLQEESASDDATKFSR